MGRGSAPGRPLALTPLPPLHDPRWLQALTKYEHAYFHSPSETRCDIPAAYGAPRFTVLSTDYVDGEFGTHAFNYYTTPEELLSALILKVRRKSCKISAAEYEPVQDTFNIVQFGRGCTGYIPPRLNNPLRNVSNSVSKTRTKRVRNIELAYGQVGAGWYSDTRFLAVSINPKGSVWARAVVSFNDIKSLSISHSIAPFGLMAAYDLDVSDQPLPLRFSLSYTDADGTSHEVFEPS